MNNFEKIQADVHDWYSRNKLKLRFYPMFCPDIPDDSSELFKATLLAYFLEHAPKKVQYWINHVASESMKYDLEHFGQKHADTSESVLRQYLNLNGIFKVVNYDGDLNDSTTHKYKYTDDKIVLTRQTTDSQQFEDRIHQSVFIMANIDGQLVQFNCYKSHYVTDTKFNSELQGLFAEYSSDLSYSKLKEIFDTDEYAHIKAKFHEALDQVNTSNFSNNINAAFHILDNNEFEKLIDFMHLQTNVYEQIAEGIKDDKEAVHMYYSLSEPAAKKVLDICVPGNDTKALTTYLSLYDSSSFNNWSELMSAISGLGRAQAELPHMELPTL